MRALVCHGYGTGENLALEQRPVPEAGQGEIRVKVLACGANASDWEFITGRPAYARIARLFMRGRNVFGSDVVGIVDKLGAGVSGFEPGQRVLADTFEIFGGFADHAVAKAGLWVPVPDGISDVDAAALPQSGAIAMDGIARRVRPGMKVLINGGGGGSGPLAIQLAKAGGAQVWAVDTAGKAGVMAEAGADHLIDFETEDFARGAERFDLVLDLWGTRPVRAVRRVLAPGGRYMLVGAPMARLLGIAVWGGLTSLVSSRKVGLLMVRQGPKHLPALLDMVKTHRLKPRVGEVATLDDAAEALKRMGARKIAGKLVIVP
ncbi:NAD(P)-dependent alcohol dehydrogenase [Maritimibacter sp. HL-12]|uniref:NAD(P)-dependent alcohol dehydrogenase n=1 Tax=Maritimibacter sp. HL-12 TaxID=1162418 RepID=UPI000A0F1EEA|nr:NAD(P)-dependent alcohol dehydrogenase [Maritimibacter sp. HL-12]SMH41699.1 NADPH:quinone reductase [Maritimibacter sp. HL-12]